MSFGAIRQNRNEITYLAPSNQSAESLYRRVKRVCGRIGAQVEWSKVNRALEVTLIAPKGKVWRSNGEHTLTGTSPTQDKAWIHEMILDLLDEVDKGFTRCPGRDGEMFGDGEYCQICTSDQTEEE